MSVRKYKISYIIRQIVISNLKECLGDLEEKGIASF